MSLEKRVVEAFARIEVKPPFTTDPTLVRYDPTNQQVGGVVFRLRQLRNETDLLALEGPEFDRRVKQVWELVRWIHVDDELGPMAGREMKMLYLAQVTRRQLREAISAGMDTAIVPLGATEQHGEALPFGTDTIIGEQIAADLAERLNALLLPALPFGVSVEHMSTPGTLTLSSATLTTVVRELCESLVLNGFTRVILLVAHFGNIAPAETAAEEVVSKTGAIVCVSTYFADMRIPALEVLGVDPDALDWAFFDSHGGAAEAAMVMASNSDLIDTDFAQVASPARSNVFYDRAMKYPHRVEEATPTGQWGDPRRISPGIDLPVNGELGRKLIAACGSQLADKFQVLLNEVEQGRAGAPAMPETAQWRNRT
jgi:creatinine amidohydrolase